MTMTILSAYVAIVAAMVVSRGGNFAASKKIIEAIAIINRLRRWQFNIAIIFTIVSIVIHHYTPYYSRAAATYCRTPSPMNVTLEYLKLILNSSTIKSSESCTTGMASLVLVDGHRIVIKPTVVIFFSAGVYISSDIYMLLTACVLGTNKGKKRGKKWCECLKQEFCWTF